MKRLFIILSILCAGFSVILILKLLKEKQRKEFVREEMGDFFDYK